MLFDVFLTFESLNEIQLKLKFPRSSSIPYHLIPTPALFCWHPLIALFFFFFCFPSRHWGTRFPYTSHYRFSLVPALCHPVPFLYSFIRWTVFRDIQWVLYKISNRHKADTIVLILWWTWRECPPAVFSPPSFAQFTLSVESESFLTVLVGIPLAMRLLSPYSCIGVNCAVGLV